MNQRFFYSLGLCLLLGIGTLSAQTSELPYETIALQNLTDFKPTGSNWKIAGDVIYDLNKAGAAIIKPGTGVLVNDLSGKSKENLFTKMEHGDIELELDFMLDKGSNSGIYLQGRYEVQLLDSWGVKTPGASDCGAIYERWDTSRPEGRRGYEGHPPIQNVSKAPGLWQHLKIVFRAPRFNEKGEKTANATFVKISQNGVTIQENIEVTGPTRGPAFADEKPTGPLKIQGDHGPVAFRNIRYKAYGIEPVTLTSMKLSAYDGKFASVSDFEALTPRRQMDIDRLAHLIPGSRDNFGGKITGTLHIPRSGQYLLNLNLRWIPTESDPKRPNGAGVLTVDGKKLLDIDGKNGGTATTKVTLNAGDYPLVLAYYKNFGLWYARSNDILLSVEGPGVEYTTLNPVIQVEEPVSEITVMATTEPTMQRGFVNHRGRKHTHTISVGEPDQVNYSIDLSKGEFLQVWRGNFLETTPMWHERGETQLSVPLGSVIELAGKPSLAFLTDPSTAWPDSNATYNNLGYDVDKNGRPVFKYTLGSASVRESLAATDQGHKLAHTFTVTPGPETQPIWCRVAEGSDITRQPNGLYAVNDRQFFVELPAGVQPVIRRTAQNTTEMLLPVVGNAGSGTVTYSFVW